MGGFNAVDIANNEFDSHTEKKMSSMRKYKTGSLKPQSVCIVHTPDDCLSVAVLQIETAASPSGTSREADLYPLSSLAACSNALCDAAEPSNLREAMAAWWDMLFLNTSPFLHSVISCTRKRPEVVLETSWACSSSLRLYTVSHSGVALVTGHFK